MYYYESFYDFKNSRKKYNTKRDLLDKQKRLKDRRRERNRGGEARREKIV